MCDAALYLQLVHKYVYMISLDIVQKGGLSGGSQYSLPILVFHSQLIPLIIVHLAQRYHCSPVFEMADCEIGVAAHQPLNGIYSDLTKLSIMYLHSLVSRELAGTDLTAFWVSKKYILF